MKHIMFVSGSMQRGGAERVISLLCDYFTKRGDSVSVAMLLHHEIDYVLPKTVQIHDLANEKVNKLFRFPKLVNDFRQLVKKERPDVIVAFMAPICTVAGIACKGLNTRFIASERIDPSMVKRNWVYCRVLNWIYATADKTVLQTQKAMSYFPKRVRDNSCVIANPIHVSVIAATPQNRIVTAGRLTEQKNHKMLIRAFAAFHQRHPEYTLTIYGDGPLRNELNALIEEMHLTEAAALPGNVLNIHEEIADASMFVLSSDFEGLSNAMLEAMMMGLPTISTRCAGADEYIIDHENGMLVDVGDEEALIHAMNEVADRPEDAVRMKQRAIERVEGLRASTIMEEWNRVITGE